MVRLSDGRGLGQPNEVVDQPLGSLSVAMLLWNSQQRADSGVAEGGSRRQRRDQSERFVPPSRNMGQRRNGRPAHLGVLGVQLLDHRLPQRSSQLG